MNQQIPPHLTIQDLKHPDRKKGERFSSLLLIRKVDSRVARNNNPFLRIEFGDRFGSFSTTCFDDHPHFNTLQNNAEGQAVILTGEIDFYQGRFSPKLLNLRFLSEEELAQPNLTENLVETSPENLDDLMLELADFIASIQHDGIRKTIENVFTEAGDVFRESTAAISMHHAYRGGLLEHTIHVARACKALLPLYQEVDPDLAMAGALVHDIGKCVEYSGNLTIRKSRSGILQGHVVLGYRIVRKAGMMARLDPDLLERLEHIVLSHQGELEWGAAAMAATPEAVFVSMIDNLDAKMGMVQQALRNAQEDQEFSDFLPGLQAPILLTKPPTTPETDPASDSSETEITEESTILDS